MCSAGATLQGSFSGGTGNVTETGFYYGTSSPTIKVAATGTSSPFSMALSGLTANTTYYYKAYVIDNGQETQGNQESFKTKAVATASVTTSAVSNLKPTTVTFNGSFNGATGTIHDRGFYYKKDSESSWAQIGLNSTTGTAGSFSANIDGLSENTAYQVKAYVLEWDENANTVVERVGSVVSFTTQTSGSITPTNLDGFGIPDVSGILSGTGTSGTNSTVGDNWYRYNTTNNKRQIAVHTYNHSTYGETVNYVVVYDGNNYAPLWTAHTMNTTYWPDNNFTRDDNWISDPAISLTQISGLDDNSQYSRGHLVAAQYRKCSQNSIDQTFYYTNKAPQWQNGFNNGVWSSLETQVKTKAPSGNTEMLYVVTGVLYEGTLSYMSKGDLNVPIPSHFYKCIMACTLNGSGEVTGAQGIAFVYTNKSHTGDNYYDTSYVTSIDSIEQRAGFNFFASVPATYQNSAEANTNHNWFTGQSSPNNTISPVTNNYWWNP